MLRAAKAAVPPEFPPNADTLVSCNGKPRPCLLGITRSAGRSKGIFRLRLRRLAPPGSSLSAAKTVLVLVIAYLPRIVYPKKMRLSTFLLENILTCGRRCFLSHLRCEVTAFSPVAAPPRLCLRRILPKSAGQRPSPVFPRWPRHRSRASGG